MSRFLPPGELMASETFQPVWFSLGGTDEIRGLKSELSLNYRIAVVFSPMTFLLISPDQERWIADVAPQVATKHF